MQAQHRRRSEVEQRPCRLAPLDSGDGRSGWAERGPVVVGDGWPGAGRVQLARWCGWGDRGAVVGVERRGFVGLRWFGGPLA